MVSGFSDRGVKGQRNPDPTSDCLRALARRTLSAISSLEYL